MSVEPPSSAPQSGGYISLNHVRPLLDYLEVQQLPIASVLKALRITQDQQRDVDRVIDATDEDAAFSAALALTGDVDMGLRAGAGMTSANLGPLGHLLMTSGNIVDVFNFHTIYAEVVGNGMRPEYLFDQDEVVLVLHRRMPGVYKNGRQVLDYSLAGWLAIARWLAGQEFSPTLIELPYKTPIDLRAHQEILRCPLGFGRPMVKVHFSIQALSMQFRHTYPGLQKVLEGEVENCLNKANPPGDLWLEQVSDQLLSLLAKPSLSLASLAILMKTTPRTLQREFKSHNTTYVDVLDQLRKTQAEGLVSDHGLSLSEISQALGFAEQSAFQRAFKRWYSKTPGDFRKEGPSGSSH